MIALCVMGLWIAEGLVLPGGGAFALPQGASVESGDVSIASSGDGVLQITAPDQAIIRWDSFDIASSERVQFLQPSATATALNRVVGGQHSQIAGSLSANGWIFLINPAGLTFAPSAVVNVGGLVASSLDLSNEAFLSRHYQFLQPEGALPGAVVNRGTLTATAPGGLIALLGGAVANAGTITARLGTVALASGSQMVLSIAPDVAVAVEAPTAAVVVGPAGRLEDAAANTGQIHAQHVLVTASALHDLLTHVVNNTGVIEATAVEQRGGRILLTGTGGVVRQAGTLSAGASDGGRAGEITVVGRDGVTLEPGSRIAATGGAGVGAGGAVAINAPAGQTLFGPGAILDVSGGRAGGDAGSVELSGTTLQFGGQVLGEAQDGFLGGRLLVDPLAIIFNTTTQPSPPNNPSGTPDIAFSDPPAAGTTTVQINDIVGFAQAWFEAAQDITVNNPLTMNNNNDLVLRAGRDLILNANVRVQGGSGDMTLVADADFSASGGAASDGIGTILQAAGTTLQAGNGIMTLQTGGDFMIRAISGGGSGTISITSTAGNLLDDGNAATRITGGTVTLVANGSGKGIGTTGALNTDINTLNLTAGSSGAAIQDVGSFTLNAPTVATNGSLNLRADRDVTIASGAAVALTGAGTATFLADADGNGEGTVVQGIGSSVTTGGGALTISVADDMIVRTLNAGSGAVSITGVGSGTDITDDGEDTTKITGGALTLAAGGRIGGSGTSDLDTSVSTVSAMANSGSIFLNNDQALAVTSAVANGSGNDVTITTLGNLSVGAVTAADDITLSAGASIVDGGSLITGDLVTLAAGANLGSAAAPLHLAANAWDVTGSAGSAHLQAQAGNVTIASQATAAGVTTWGTSKGTIRTAAAGDLTLQTAAGALTTTPALALGGGSLALRASGDLTLNGSLTATGLGTLTLVADSDGNGTGTFTQTAGTAITAGSGTIVVSSAGTPTLRTLTTGGTMVVTSTGGSVLNTGTSMTAGTLTVTTAGTIGTASTTLPVVVSGGTMTVSPSGLDGDVSGNVSGTVTPSNTLVISNTPPGRVLFNGVQLYPPIVAPPPPPTPPPAPAPSVTLPPSTATLDFANLAGLFGRFLKKRLSAADL